jgi:hypothetical protein
MKLLKNDKDEIVEYFNIQRAVIQSTIQEELIGCGDILYEYIFKDTYKIMESLPKKYFGLAAGVNIKLPTNRYMQYLFLRFNSKRPIPAEGYTYYNTGYCGIRIDIDELSEFVEIRDTCTKILDRFEVVSITWKDYTLLKECVARSSSTSYLLSVRPDSIICLEKLFPNMITTIKKDFEKYKLKVKNDM